MTLISIVLPFLIVLVSLTIHEAAHAFTAEKLGDPTARLLGRVSLNPLVHIDPIGTILLPLLSAYTGLLVIGWAKPVPVNVSRLRNGRRDFMLVAAAGPISNLLQALAGSIAYRVLADSSSGGGIAAEICGYFVVTNLVLAFFNLIPVPPLDGGNVLSGLLPESAEPMFHFLRQYGFIVLYGLLLAGVVDDIIGPPTSFFERILLP